MSAAVSWSWLWDSASAPTSIPDLPAWYVDLLERTFKRCPPSLPASTRHAAVRIAGDRSTRMPRLSARLSEVTRRALAVLEPDLLYELLTIDDVDQRGTPRPSPHAKTARTGESARTRWRRIGETMRSLAADLHVEGTHCASAHTPSTFVTPTSAGELHACGLLEQWATLADARAEAAARPRSDTAAAPDSPHVHRARLQILAEVLRTAGGTWTTAELTELLVASERDWRQPPSPLARDADITALSRWIDEHVPAMPTMPTTRGKRRAARRSRRGS